MAPTDRSITPPLMAGTVEEPPGAIERLVLDQLPVAVAATDVQGIVTHWSRHSESLFGWTAEEAVGRNLLDLLVDAPDREAADAMLASARVGEPSHGELRVRRRDGSRLVCRLSQSPLHGNGGTLAGIAWAWMDITRDKESDRRLVARTTVTRVLAEAMSVEEAVPNVLQAVCQSLGWEVGVLWRVAQAANRLYCADLWRAPEVKANEFEAITRNIAFERGVGLPGRVWASGAPAWIPDVVQDRNFPRARVAALEQLHGGVGSPIVLAGEVLGVIEFFSHDVKEPDEELLQVMSVIGSQIGQFIQRKEAEAELRSSREQLEAIFRSVAEGITVQDRTGRLVFANDAAAVFAGYPSAQAMLEASVDDLLAGFEIEDESGNPLTPEELPGRLALQGAGSHERVLRLRSLPHGQERWSMIRATPVFDDRGRVRFAVSVFHDITTQKREEEAQRFLSEAGELLAASVLNYEETLAGLAELAVSRLADWCAIHLRQEHGSLRQISVAHVDQSMVDLAEEMGRRYPPDPHAPRGVGRVVRTGRSEIYPEISDEMLVGAAQDTDQLSMLRGLGLRSGMVVPLAARGRILGAMTFVSAKSGRAYGPADLALAEELARRAALAVDNAMAYAERDHIARTLQQSLLPPDLPKIPGMEIASRYRAAGEGKEVGGDFYDVFPTGDRGWAIVIGDVCGKGPEAAAVTGLARYTIRATAMQERKPSNILLALNEAVLQQRSDYMFCTVAYARVRLNPDKARVTICCAGHPLPMLLRADGTVETVGTPGTLLGVFPDPQLKDRPVDLGPGDSLVLFTDGVVEEHVGRRVFGRAGLASLLESSAGQTAERIADAIDRAVIEFSPGVPRDDIAVLVLRKKA